ncbi:anhydro-N-acetylmuramic acid kinase [Sulfuritortus calidifontis]|uniref:anhydro-N-acetylmuramic acid kinase n=1 Tax=Sulfuritortus calidifontis TaxID=1914471 RepID=UPI000F822B0A|nr:anhydro-N-acetylmuramic acid kinase [Sulfuritortus calidifontis]
MQQDLFIGLMSGTSLDGVDAVVVSLQSTPTLLATHVLPYPDTLRQALLALHEPSDNELDKAARLANQLADLYAETVHQLLAKAELPASAIRAIGCHGQTVRHRPADGYTLQLVNAARLAERCGITVVADFRSRDIAAGGQGAPLVPAFHAGIFRQAGQTRTIVNIGGIANLTYLPDAGPVLGFDCGPGNMLMDAWVQRHWYQHYDEGGLLASQGEILPGLLERLLSHPFLHAVPPKSAGREEFNLAWLDGLLTGHEVPADVLRTLLELTAEAIVQAIRQHCPDTQAIYLCGGGAHNRMLQSVLTRKLKDMKLGSTDELGVGVDWVEAMAFAWLGAQALEGKPGNLPEVTGAAGPRVLGGIYPA